MADDKQLERFRQAVEDKHENERAGGGEEQPEVHDPAQPQDTHDERAKSTRHKKMTADKWNQ